MNAHHLHATTHVLTLLVVLYAPVTVGMNWLLMEGLAMVSSYNSDFVLCPILAFHVCVTYL